MFIYNGLAILFLSLSLHDFKRFTLVLAHMRTPNATSIVSYRTLHGTLWRWLRHQQNLAPGVWASPPLRLNRHDLSGSWEALRASRARRPDDYVGGKVLAITREKDTVLAMP